MQRDLIVLQLTLNLCLITISIKLIVNSWYVKWSYNILSVNRREKCKERKDKIGFVDRKQKKELYLMVNRARLWFWLDSEG